jgi:hypothetical protein
LLGRFDSIRPDKNPGLHSFDTLNATTTASLEHSWW